MIKKPTIIKLVSIYFIITNIGMNLLAKEIDPKVKGKEIAFNVEKANEGFGGETSTMEMILINARGEKTTRKMTSKIFEVKGDGDKSLIEFELPADVAGTRMLTWSHKIKDNDQWMYLPAFKKIKRISSRNKTGSFMGSEFSFEDLGSQEPEKYEQIYIGEEEINGRKCWVLEQVPTDPKSGYTKLKTWIDQGYMNAAKIQYYDRKGSLLKTALFSDYKQHGQFWRIGKITMRNHQTKKSSVLTWVNRKLTKDIKNSEFDKAELDQ